MKTKGHCERHPKYKAIRKPRVDCEKCWELYYKNRGELK